MSEKVKEALFIGLLALIAAGLVVNAYLWLPRIVSPVYAAPAAKYQEPGCTPLGTVGDIIVGRCVDEVGNVVFANSSGFMAVVP